VLYDAVAILPSEQGVALLAREATAKDFVSDAFMPSSSPTSRRRGR
jgi:catalase